MVHHLYIYYCIFLLHWVCISEWANECVFVCVCVWEREREREWKRKTKRERVCFPVFAHAFPHPDKTWSLLVLSLLLSEQMIYALRHMVVLITNMCPTEEEWPLKKQLNIQFSMWCLIDCAFSCVWLWMPLFTHIEPLCIAFAISAPFRQTGFKML